MRILDIFKNPATGNVVALEAVGKRRLRGGDV